MSKGRSKQKIAARDKKLFERYYYWSEVCRLRFDDTIAKLANEEFFLSEARVLQIVRGKIANGCTVNGNEVKPSPLFGFRRKHKKKSSLSSELSLF